MPVFLVLLGFFWLSCPALAGETAPPGVTLRDAALPAQGTHSTEISLPAFGRYALAVQSEQGVALQVVDKVAGPGEFYGEAGKRDGRWDGFLERGAYRLRTQGADDARGEAKLLVRRFSELLEPAPQLVALKPVKGSLDDFQQRSYWLNIEQPQVVLLEAAGRYLADLRLWQDGSWLADVTPEIYTHEAQPGRPLTFCRLYLRLEPGLYRLTAYGGPGQPWAEESTESPFYLRYGTATLGEAGRQRFNLSEFGHDRWLVPKTTDYFRLELPLETPDEGEIEITVSAYDPQNPSPDQGVSARISKDAKLPWVELRHTTDKPYHLVEINGLAGQPYVLQQFPQRDQHTLNGPGNYWIDTPRGGDPADNLASTALLARWAENQPEQLAGGNAVLLDGKNGWQGRFNLTGPSTLFLRVAKTGKYRLKTEGIATKFRIEPFLTSRPADYRQPPDQESGYVWDLQAGYYVLSLRPEQAGILDLSLGPKLPGFKSSENGRIGAVRLENARYHLYLNQVADSPGGLVIRELPINLADPLPVRLAADEELSLPIHLPEAGRVQAVDERGQPVELSIDQGPWQPQVDLKPGNYNARLRARDAVSLSLGLSPRRLSAETPLPPLPNGITLPDFPVLRAEAPQFFDLDKDASQTFQFEVEQPALYRLETTGLLATAGSLRTRILPMLAEGDSNGVGRNTLVQQYLGQGAYQFTVWAQGDSHGHLGAQLAATPLVEGGALRPGIPARATLAPGQALVYRLIVNETADYHLRIQGLNRVLQMRLEDSAGWPLISPGQAAELTLRLETGEYRAIVLPEAVQARVLATLDAVPQPARLRGHGPHRLPFSTLIQHLWEEPTVAGQPRAPDQWEFDLPAQAEIKITLDNDMRGDLIGPQGQPVAEVVSGRGWQGELPAGAYRLQLAQRRPNNRVPYSLSVTPTPLLAGYSRVVQAPAEIPLSIGRDGLSEVYSLGSQDVRARLFNAQNRLVAQSDDRADDWNFQLAANLPAGNYRLRVEPVAEETAETTVFLRTPPEQAENPLTLPADWALEDDQVHLYPLALPAEANFLVIRADQPVGLAVEQQTEAGWKNLTGLEDLSGSGLEVPLAAGTAYRLRAWKTDRQIGRVALRAATAQVPLADEAQLATGIAGLEVEGRTVAAVRLKTPGLFQVDTAPLTELVEVSEPAEVSRAIPLTEPVEVSGIRAPSISAGSDNQALRAADHHKIYGLGTTLWLASNHPARFHGQRRLLGADSLPLGLGAGQRARVDVAASQDGPALFLAQSRQGQPGLALPGAAGLDIAPGVAVAVSLQAPPSVEIWNAGDAGLPLETSLAYFSFAAPAPAATGWGVWQGVLQGKSAQRLTLLPGHKRLTLALPAGSAAVFSLQDHITSLHWGGDLAEIAETAADSVWLLHTADRAAGVSLVIEPLTGAPRSELTPGALWQQANATAGIVRLPIAQGVAVHVEGASQAQFLAADGQVRAGLSLTTPAPGTLIVRHPPGNLVIWAEGPADNVGNSPATDTVSVPASLALTGAQQILRFDNAQPALLHLRSDSPLIARWRNAEGESLSLHPHGALLHLYTPPGASSLVLYPLGQTVLSGNLRVSHSQISPLAEGIGPEILLAGGAAQAYSFTLAARATVGLGLRASADTVQALLLDSQGRRLSEGVVHYHTLEPGTYSLLAQVPPTSAPVRLRPVALGLRPAAGPPPELIEQFVRANPSTGSGQAAQDGMITSTAPPELEAAPETPEDSSEAYQEYGDPPAEDSGENQEYGSPESYQEEYSEETGEEAEE